MRSWKTWVLVALVLAAAGFGWFRWHAASQLEAAEQRVRDAGYPVTYAELDAYYERPPAEENRAYVLQYAMDVEVHTPSDAMDNLPIAGSAELPHRSEPVPAEQVEAMHGFLLQNVEAIESVFESFQLEECRFPIDVNLGPNTSLDHLARLRSLARMLSIASIVSTINGDTAEAAKHLAGIFELAESLENEPFLISQLVRIAIHGIGWSAVEQSLNRADFPAGDLERLQAKLVEVEANRAFVNGLVGERCMWNAMESVRFSPGNKKIGAIDPQELFISVVYRPSGLMDLDGVGFFELYRKLVAATELPVQEQVSRAAAIEAETMNDGGLGMFTAILMPSVARSIEADVRNRSLLRITITALAVARHRAEQGAYAGSLDVLVPAYLDTVPIDPYGGAPVHYRRLEDGFVVYSLGQNLTDDGGVESENLGDAWRKGDLTFTVEPGN